MTDTPERAATLLRRADALAAGYDDAELARLVRRGHLRRVQRGTYLRPGAEVPAPRAAVLATVAGLHRPGAVSHASAAVLHGLPLWGVPLGRVHVTRRPPAAGSGSARVHLHVARLADDEVTVVDGIAVTGVTRTVVDLARELPFEPAVVAADAALGARATTPGALAACLAAMGPVPGSRRATRVLAFADGRSESVGESRSRVLLSRLGLAPSTLQRPVLSADGALLGRADFAWDHARVLGEFDGRVKYGRLLRPGQDAGEAVFEEKRREDALRDEGWRVVRWVWSDLVPGDVVGDRVRRAINRRRP